MIDVKYEDGEVCTDSTGRAVFISGIDACFQRAKLRLNALHEGFVYNRDFGCELIGKADPVNLQNQYRELMLSRAIARLDNTKISVSDGDVTITVTTKTDKKIIRREACLL